MFVNNRRYIGENETRDDYINLDLRLSSRAYEWEKAIGILRERLEGRFLNPIDTLIQTDIIKNGFAAMALCCLLIETLMQFREGIPETPCNENKRYYTDFLVNQLGQSFDIRTAKRFYNDIRCGILHSAQTKNGSCLTPDTDYTVRIQGNRIMMVSIQGTYYELRHYFYRYCDELKDSNERDLRANFIKKMDDITKKWDGSNIVDNLWFAICAKEGLEIERRDGRTFSFRVVNGDKLKIGNNVYISKEEIEDALYYWPNEQAIQMQEKSRFILPLFHLCEDIANDIIQQQIA